MSANLAIPKRRLGNHEVGAPDAAAVDEAAKPDGWWLKGWVVDATTHPMSRGRSQQLW